MSERGRPSLFTQEIADEVCDRLASGQSLREICRDEHIPEATTVRRWAIENREGFSSQYARARESQADHYADEIIEIAEDGTNDWVKRRRKDGTIETVLDREHVQRSILRVDSRKWLMARMAPRKWGDRQKLEHSGADGNPLGFVLIPAKKGD